MPAAVAVRSSHEHASPDADEPSAAALAQALSLACLAVVLLEITYTRLFSFKLFYYFTYLIIGIALLGGGSGGVTVALSRRLRRASLDRVFGASCLAAAAAVLVGYWPVALTRLNAIDLAQAVSLTRVFDRDVATAETGKLLFICACVFAPFFAAGIAVSKLFATRTERIGRLYFADLLGAGVGCALAVPLLE